MAQSGEALEAILAEKSHWCLTPSDTRILVTKYYPELLMEGQQMQLEIELSTSPANVTVRIHGNCARIKELGTWRAECVNLHTLVTLLELTPICIGFAVAHSVDILDSGGQKQSKIAMFCENGVSSIRILSNNCSVLAKSVQGYCDNCSYLNKLYKNKVQRMVDTPSPFCNDRYLNVDGLKQKALLMKKEIRSVKVRAERQQEKAEEKESVMLCENDHQDMLAIFEGCREQDVPEEIKTLWQEQLKQLSSKSKRGHRWNTR